MSDVTDSIMLSIKKLNNVAPDYTAFDDDFIMYINAALADLHQLGIGPDEGFSIEGPEDLWDDFVEPGPIYNRVKDYVGLHVRMRFDPPATSFAINMMQDQLEERAERLVWAQQDKEAEEVS